MHVYTDRSDVGVDVGVEKVSASTRTGLVVVSGRADVRMLKRRIENTMGKPVNIISDGGAAPEPVNAGWERPNHWERPNNWAPPQHAPPRRGWVIPHGHRAPKTANAYPYDGGNNWAPAQPHVYHGVPVRLDDEDCVESCCSIQ
jgi:hypothetical protein